MLGSLSVQMEVATPMVMRDTNMDNLVNQVRNLMDKGVYDPEQLFKVLYNRNRVHYSKVREAIDIAKNY